jgi:hypothetical protein
MSRFCPFLVAVLAASTVACDDNECESLALALCEYESFTSDDDEGRAKQRSDDCKCFTEGADSLETNPAIMRCVSLLEHVSALTGGSEFGIATLHACRAAHNQLDEFKDRYIEVCIQTDGTKECRNTLEACTEDCPEECKEECPGEDPEDCADCHTACYMGCATKYPCDSMCIDFDFTDFVPEVNPENGGGGGDYDAGIALPCEGASTGDGCNGGWCVDIQGFMTCAPECTTVGNACSTGACYYMDGGKTVCTPSGYGTPGDSCSSFNDCATGSQCLDDGSGLRCFLVCGSSGDCGDSEECMETGLGFYVCYGSY